MLRSATVVIFTLCLAAVTAKAFGPGKKAEAEPEPDATLVFPTEQSEADWRARCFWPMTNAYAWQLPSVPDGKYRIVTRYGSSKHESPFSAADGKELKETKFMTINSEDFAANRNGFVSFQTIDLADMGLTDESSSDRLVMTFGVKDVSFSSVAAKFSAGIMGSTRSHSPKSKPRWKNDELHLISFTSTEPDSQLAIRYDVFLVRSLEP